MDYNKENYENGSKSNVNWRNPTHRIYPENFAHAPIVAKDDTQLWQIYRVAPEDRELFLRFRQARAMERQSKYATGPSIIFIGVLYMLYDFLMTYYNVGG